MKEYRKKEEYYRLIKTTLALPLLPLEDARAVWRNHLKPELEELDATGEFPKYFEHQWMKLRPTLWNFYQLDHRTTNAAEAFHSFLKR